MFVPFYSNRRLPIKKPRQSWKLDCSGRISLGCPCYHLNSAKRRTHAALSRAHPVQTTHLPFSGKLPLHCSEATFFCAARKLAPTVFSLSESAAEYSSSSLHFTHFLLYRFSAGLSRAILGKFIVDNSLKIYYNKIMSESLPEHSTGSAAAAGL